MISQENPNRYIIGGVDDGYSAKIEKSYTIMGMNYISLQITTPDGVKTWQLPVRSLPDQLNKGVRTSRQSSSQVSQ